MKKPLLLCIVSFLFLKASSQQLTAVSVNLFTYLEENNNERALEDGIAVFFSGYSDTVDLFDLRKLTNPLENIAIVREGILLAGEHRTNYDTIPLTLWNLQQRDYELEIILRNIPYAALEDVATNTKQYFTLTDTLRYKFTNTIAGSPKDSAVRFRLLFEQQPTEPPVTKDCKRDDDRRPPRRNDNIRVYPNPVRGDYVNLLLDDDAPEGRYTVTFTNPYFVSSQSFYHNKDNADRIDVSKLRRGKYYITVQDESGWRETRQIEID
ncbi:MAG: hypothetical protein QM791_07780 [Ferruginibacter sp.]